jgi:hypothetical protein
VVEQIAHQGAAADSTEASHPVSYIREKALPGLLTVIAYVDTRLHLGSDGVRRRPSHLFSELVIIDGFTPAPLPMELGQRRRARQAPRVRRENPLVAGKHVPSVTR